MKKMIFVLSAISLLAGMSYAFPGPDSIGMYGSTTDPVTTLTTSAPFEQVNIYLMITNPSLGGVSGWECKVEITGDAFTAPGWTYGGGGLNVYDAVATGLFNVGIGPGADAIRSDVTTGACLIATLTAFVQLPTQSMELYVLPFPGSVTFPGDIGPGYVDPDNVGVVQTLVTATGGTDVEGTWTRNPVFVVNPGVTPVSNEDTTWSTVKTLFR
jgi:hypothetical protein